MKRFFVYIMASQRNGTLYIGVTSDIIKRVWEHKAKVIDGFTKKYDIGLLVYYGCFEDVERAIRREKRLKKYSRQWKMNLIEEKNPQWHDLYESLLQ
jgi:putative endonuclease